MQLIMVVVGPVRESLSTRSEGSCLVVQGVTLVLGILVLVRPRSLGQRAGELRVHCRPLWVKLFGGRSKKKGEYDCDLCQLGRERRHLNGTYNPKGAQSACPTPITDPRS